MDLRNKDKSFFELDTEPDSNVSRSNDMPDYKAADSLAHVELNKKYAVIKTNSINKTKEVKVAQNLLKPIGYLLALVAGFIFSVFFPGSGIENSLVGLIATVAGLLGITDWRAQFDNFEGYFKSKTTIGAFLVFIPVLASVVIGTLLHVVIPQWAQVLIDWLLTAGGGTALIGIFHANTKAVK